MDVSLTSSRLCTLVLLTLLSTLATGCASSRSLVGKVVPNREQQFEVRMKLAQAHEHENRMREAEEIYRELQKKKPDHPLVHHRLGVIYSATGRIEEGIAELEAARATQPRNSRLLNDLGYAYFMQDNLEAAESTLRAALELDPSDKRTNVNLGLVVAHAGRTSEAYGLLRQALPEADTLANLAYVHTQRGEGALAMKTYHRALAANPNHKTAAQGLIQLAELEKKASRNEESPTMIAGKPEDRVQSASLSDRSNQRPEDRSTTIRQVAAEDAPSSAKEVQFSISEGSGAVRINPGNSADDGHRVPNRSVLTRTAPMSTPAASSTAFDPEPEFQAPSTYRPNSYPPSADEPSPFAPSGPQTSGHQRTTTDEFRVESRDEYQTPGVMMQPKVRITPQMAQPVQPVSQPVRQPTQPTIQFAPPVQSARPAVQPAAVQAETRGSAPAPVRAAPAMPDDVLEVVEPKFEFPWAVQP